MIVPQYWAEGRVQVRTRDRQVTVRRFGWSDASQAEAQAHADGRAKAAYDRIVAGERLARREPKVAYNGAEGVPIREEVIARYGQNVITRNAYGARCLNTPNVLFVDVDFSNRIVPIQFFVKFLLGGMVGLIVGFAMQSAIYGVGAMLGVVILGTLIFHRKPGLTKRLQDVEAQSRRRIDRFLARHPDWHFRIYRTPAGLRLLAMHRTFDPREPAVAECFRELGTDPIYSRMCLNQNCFRARISPKPWRIGIASHMRPRPGVWPVAPEMLPARTEWVKDYEAKAEEFSACHFEESVGSGSEDSTARTVQRLHDDLCQATSDRPIA
jgi:hypothetical protein